MEEKNIQVYSYRWIVLLLFMFANITMQILWISFATVTLEATAFYGVEEFDILLLSMIFMIVYIPVTFLASWVISKYGLRIGAGIGALLGGIFGLLRFFTGGDYTLVLIFQLGIAIGQPFILNSITKLSANWFPESERTTATGLSTLSQFVGIMLGMLLTPFIVLGTSFEIMILTYGILALISGLLFVIFVKDKPPTPPSYELITEQIPMGESLRRLFKNRVFLILIILFFIGLGTFNMITTYIELIVIPKSPSFDATFAGILGALMLIGGIIGCIVMSGLSDKFQKRKPLIISSTFLATISLIIITFTSDGAILLIFGFIFGFGLLSAAPVALEYAVEITKPVPESHSNGMLLMIGQIGGIIFILGMEELKLPSGDYLPALLIQSILAAILFVLSLFLKEKASK